MKSGGGSSSGPATAGAYGNSGNQTPQGPGPNTTQWASVLPQDPMASAQLGDPTVQRFSDSSEATPELLKAKLAEAMINRQQGPALPGAASTPIARLQKQLKMGGIKGGLMGALLAGTDEEPDDDIWAYKYGANNRNA